MIDENDQVWIGRGKVIRKLETEDGNMNKANTTVKTIVGKIKGGPDHLHNDAEHL